MAIELNDFAGAVSNLLSFAEEEKDDYLKELTEKLRKNIVEVTEAVNAIEEIKRREGNTHSAETAERNLIEDSKSLAKKSVAEWKALRALAIDIDYIAPKLGINKKDAEYLKVRLVKASYKLENEIPIEYAKYKAFEELGWNAHHTTLNDTLYFLVPLVAYILLERR